MELLKGFLVLISLTAIFVEVNSHPAAVIRVATPALRRALFAGSKAYLDNSQIAVTPFFQPKTNLVGQYGPYEIRPVSPQVWMESKSKILEELRKAEVIKSTEMEDHAVASAIKEAIDKIPDGDTAKISKMADLFDRCADITNKADVLDWVD